MAQCEAITKSGTRCRQHTRSDEEKFCIFHSSDRAEEAAAARILGGQHRRYETTAYPGEVHTVDDLLVVLNKALQDCWAMEGGERRQRSIAQILKIMSDLMPTVDTARKLETLEALYVYNGSKDTAKKGT